MDVDGFLQDIREAKGYRGQIVHVRELAAHGARYASPPTPMAAPVREMLAARGIERLYTHQDAAIGAARRGEDILVATATASGKSLCYTVPILEALLNDPTRTALLLFPTKALCQDQFKNFAPAMREAGLSDLLAGVYDGDTPGPLRRRLRDEGAVLFTNPDMLHAGIMPQHGRWAPFLSRLAWVVVDELHVYNGIFGSNAANLFRRFDRLLGHYGARPQFAASSATIANPGEMARQVLGREPTLVTEDGSPRGRRVYVFWNPPRQRAGDWRSRRSANVEAHELMAALVMRRVPTITFSKAKMTAEMIHRYVTETLQKEGSALAAKVTPYRGGYLPTERREIERRLFDGELLGVSTTPALELGIDVGDLDASIVVGYPGTLASFFQQSGRAGRRERDACVFLVGLDTAINQYIMTNPEYIFGRPIEEGVVDPDNPFVLTGHLRCATQEMALADAETGDFGPHAATVLRVLERHGKVRRLKNRWYHAAPEIPHHEVALRALDDLNVMIEDVASGAVLGEITLQDAPPILHPDAIYMHRGDTYRVIDLDVTDKMIARVERVEVDYYTQPLGGNDVHHIDLALREKPFGTGSAHWGEVTVYCRTPMFEKVHFYELDAISRHGLNLPTFALETMAVWIVAPEELMAEGRLAGMDMHAGLRGLGYATRMILPLFMTCDTLDFSHSVGSANSPWNAVFIFERYPHGLGFTEKAYDTLDRVLPAVLAHVGACGCDEGCPCCVGKPLRQASTWNVERGEGSIPSKRAALFILEGLLGDGTGLAEPDSDDLSDSPEAEELRIERALARRLERLREPRVFHPIEPEVLTAYPDVVTDGELEGADSGKRRDKRRDFHREIRKRVAKQVPDRRLSPFAGKAEVPEGMRRGHSARPTDFSGRPREAERREAPEPPAAALDAPGEKPRTIRGGDPIAAKVWKKRRRREG